MKRIKSKHTKKIQRTNIGELLFRLKSNHFIHRIKHFFKKIIIFLKQKRRIILVISLPLAVAAIILLSQTWLIQSSFWQAKTYSNTSVFGTNVGNLDVKQLDDKLSEIKTKFESQETTLVNGDNKWTFANNQIGVSFDTEATSQSIMRLNELSFNDKYRLLKGDISSVIEPTILINLETCTNALSVVNITEVKSINASVFFDQTIKINSDQTGSKFNAKLTCQEMSKKLADGQSSVDVSLDITMANITKADFESKLSTVQSFAGEQLLLNSSNYQQVLTPAQLLELLEISKVNGELQVGWSSDRLDALVNDIATKVDTYDNRPVLGSCQSLVSVGGNWLDKTATKNIFTDMTTDNARTYSLPIVHHEPVIHSMSPVAGGNSGTVYLTYDDGLIYGNQIMNYAACYGVKITFFELGSRVAIDAAGLKRAINEGHAVQSHGYEHAIYDYGSRSYDWQNNDIKQSINAITSVTGVRPTYFRPPGGNRSQTTYDAAKANGVNLILWGVTSADSAGFGPSTICSNVLAGVFPGASILMHSTKQTTADAMPCIVEGLAAKGYSMQALR